MSDLINSKKSVVKNQQYEKYWKLTLSQTDFSSPQFIRSLQIVVNHIDKYDLSNKQFNELVKNVNAKRFHFNNNVVHNDELANTLRSIFNNDDATGASTRKQLNTFIKLGFVKPFYRGYAQGVKEYIKANDADRKRIFSDIVYSNSSFNSSQTVDDSNNNQVHFLINTLLNKKNKKLSEQEIVGLMNVDTHKKSYASEKEISQNVAYSEFIEFKKRKYNQIRYIGNILKKMNFIAFNMNPMEFFLTKDSGELIEKQGSTKRDPYRFGLMKKALYDESLCVYKKKISWFSKKEAAAYVVSHIRDSADALKNWDYDTAYNPNNAILLAMGDEDMYFDKKRMTFDGQGQPVFGPNVFDNFINECRNNNYSLDSIIYNDERKEFMKWHNQQFSLKNVKSK
ncbi:hypothetical protein [Leuconostoc gasicomitatum]|jgi:hypothetical protein|uniref:hypothetical protein n=1 Tax=Leuconostoc gasicomitatum TaxID=115778 RepID=UPI000744C079|nr:hypothetical protein [Leuconostoc gasicomitatum]MBZ5972417.1 hypothetical protein [Leuconostoc gasicomitatum]CUR64579.1 Putative Type II restriction enzyme probably recognizing GGTGA [Leuconostoc gasicomitatum KG16-1]